MLLKLIPDNTHIPFTNWRFIAMTLSAVMVISSIIAVATLGLNFGVDFKGGVTIEVVDDQPVDLGNVRSTIGALGLGEVNVTEIQDVGGAEKGILVTVEQQDTEAHEDADAAQQNAADQVREALRQLLGDDVEFRKTEVVGATVSGELVEKGILAVVLAITGMLFYIWMRFEWQFSVGSIVALVHDITITMGMFAVTRLDFNVATIAALLTIVGYSMNDTVVVYDRVRENLRKYKKKPLPELIDLSINETLTRTVMTSGTTLLSLIALFFFGGEVLRGFTAAIIFGILIGTYSSIFVASPFLLATGVKRDWSKVRVEAAATP
ncbi:MAG: protein translocase subunit SecF [Parvularculaceae bacterium]|nr:protein translocase subunit SecF [Parvularculaceae bacterium]